MERYLPGLTEFLQPNRWGNVPNYGPPGLTWHHAPQPGLLQLVPSDQHAFGSPLFFLMHPNGRGGYSIWGVRR